MSLTATCYAGDFAGIAGARENTAAVFTSFASLWLHHFLDESNVHLFIWMLGSAAFLKARCHNILTKLKGFILNASRIFWVHHWTTKEFLGTGLTAPALGNLATTLLASDFIVLLGLFSSIGRTAGSSITVHNATHLVLHGWADWFIFWRRSRNFAKIIRTARRKRHVATASLLFGTTASLKTADVLQAHAIFIGSLYVLIGKIVRRDRLVASAGGLAKVHLGLDARDLATRLERTAAKWA